MDKKINIIINQKCWLESEAKDQLVYLSKLEGVLEVVGLPDLHVGKVPIGSVVKTKDIIYPHIIGGDVGCGMRLINTGVASKKFKVERIAKKLEKLRSLDEITIPNELYRMTSTKSLGTIGGGNHFAEFQILDKVYNSEKFEELNFDKDSILLLIHSGSRGFGERLLTRFGGEKGLKIDSEEAEIYLRKHKKALEIAELNRQVIADKLLDYLGYNSKQEKVIDCYHNFVEEVDGYFYHRKGATSSKKGFVVIPGSRGSLTYIVAPKEDTSISLDSLSHGAGRKWARHMCKSRLEKKYTFEDIKNTKLKSKVICRDLDLLYQEAPKAYKNINDVIDSLIEYDLIEVVATLKPLITYKC